MDLQFAKELHFRELDRRNQLDAAPGLRVVGIGLVAGLFTQYYRVYAASGQTAPRMQVWIATLAAFSLVLAILQIVRIYLGFSWQHLASAQDLLAHYEALQDYKAQQDTAKDYDADAAFAEHLRLRLVEAATANAYSNNLRSERLYSASRWVALALALALIAGIRCVLDCVHPPS